MKPSDWEKETEVPLFTSCKQAARLVSLSLERKLTIREFLAMHIHLLMCKTCTSYHREVKALRKIFIRHEELLENTPPSADESLTPSVKQRMKDAIGSAK